VVVGVPSLGRAELQTACEDFINVIGSSSECTLYKGTLSSGVEIAVVSTSAASANEWSDRSEQQFKSKVIIIHFVASVHYCLCTTYYIAEHLPVLFQISVLSRVNHKNLMNLLGYCTCEEPFTRMMVFEYAPCGSLFEHLHSECPLSTSTE
jgi:serine/threonine protein kinase